MALTRKTPQEIKATLQVNGQGELNTLQLTYHNYPDEKYVEFTEQLRDEKLPESVGDSLVEVSRHLNAILALRLVKSFDDGTDQEYPLNYDGLALMEKDRPGILAGIIKGYHQARGVQLEKN